MVNYDTQDGYSVTSFQSPLPEQLIKSSISSSSRLNALETLEETSSLELLPSSYHPTADFVIHNNVQQHHNNGGILQPSTSILSIREVHFKHAGNYTCSPSNARNGTITIHVLRGNINFYTVVARFSCFFQFTRLESVFYNVITLIVRLSG